MSPAERASERYTVLGRLGLGGMAEVLLARMRGPQGFERLVVVKRLLAHLKDQPDFVAMFLDEARLLARIRHRNVVTVHELLEDGDEYALVMEYLEGESASAFLKRSVKRDEVDPWLGAHIVAEAAAGLQAAHSLTDERGQPLNLVHRDISPQNVFVTYAGDVKLLDFGVARADQRQSKTESGVIKGKLAYMAPEQLERSGVDSRADLFALGAVFYELTTGVKLFHRDNELAIVNAVCNDRIPPPSEVRPGYPAALEPVVLRALARDPNRRYQRADELRRDLRAALRQAPFVEAPADLLAARMRELFAARMQRKSDIVRQGEGEPPDSEGRRRVEAAHASAASRSRVVRTSRARARPWATIAVLVALAGTVGGGLAAYLIVGRADGPETPAERPPAPAAVSEIRVEVVTDPEGAEVTIGDAPPCRAPCGVELERGTTPVEVRGSLEGHAEARVTITPDHAQTLRLTLTPIPTAPAPEPEPPAETDGETEPEPPPQPRARRRRRRRSRPQPEPEPAFPVFE